MPLTTIFGARAGAFSTTAELTIRGGGKPYSNLALMPTDRMGPPPGASPPMRMTASWFGSAWIHRIQVRGAMFRARSRVPLGSVRHLTGVIRRWSFQERPHLAVHRPSACSGVKALRNTSAARRQAAKLCYRFGPLTPSARSGNLIAGDGTKNGLSRSEQRTPSKTQTTISDQLPSHGEKPLDRKSPIQVCCEPDFLDHGCARQIGTSGLLHAAASGRQRCHTIVSTTGVRLAIPGRSRPCSTSCFEHGGRFRAPTLAARSRQVNLERGGRGCCRHQWPKGWRAARLD